MIRRLSAILVAVVLALVFSTISFAQDTTKAAPVKEGKSEMAKPEMAKPEMGKGEMSKAAMYTVTCDPACGFMVRSHDQKEVVDITIKHAKRAHNKKVTEKDVKGMMKTEETAPKE